MLVSFFTGNQILLKNTMKPNFYFRKWFSCSFASFCSIKGVNMNTRDKLRIIMLLILLLIVCNTSTSAQNSPLQLLGSTELVSVASDGTQGLGSSEFSSISADGRYVAFESNAENLVDGDTNNNSDIFVHDRLTGETQRVSLHNNGTESPGGGDGAHISPDGRYVAFASQSRLVDDDIGLWNDIYVRDRHMDETQRVSIASDGTQGNQHSYYGHISADGRFVAFQSYASNLVEGDTNGFPDVFVHDRETGETSRVSIASDGTQGNHSSWGTIHLSGDGRYVVFGSSADNLVDGDTNGAQDIFVHDRVTGETQRVSIASDGTEANSGSWDPALSGDGRFVVFGSSANNLVDGDTNGFWDIFVHDRVTGETRRVSISSDGLQANGHSDIPFISLDGCCVTFASGAMNLVPDDTNSTGDVFMHDLLTGTTIRVSVSSFGEQSNGHSYYAPMSADARYIVFSSDATNLIDGDTNYHWDVFVRDREGILPTFSISGQITAPFGNPLPGVTVSSSFGTDTITDSLGYYTITDHPQGNYQVTPSLTGHTFSPPSRSVSLPPDATGQNFTGQLLPTYSLTGRLTNLAGTPLPGVVVAVESTFFVTTDSQGYYAITDLPPGTYTVVPGATDLSFSPRITSVTVPPDAVEINFVGEFAITDFRPDPNGYKFSTIGGVNYNDYTINDMRSMFGDSPVCWMVGSACVPYPQADLWWNIQNISINGGRCYGTSVSSLRFFTQIDHYSPANMVYALDPDSPVAISWAGDNFFTSARRNITYFSIMQTIDPVRSAINDAREYTPSFVLFQLMNTMDQYPTDPMTMSLWYGGSGHQITPYAITKQSSNTYMIWVYDSNHPYNPNNPGDWLRHVFIHTNTDTWNYDSSLGFWSGNANSQSIAVIPASTHNQPLQCPWCISFIENIGNTSTVWMEGAGHLLITDFQGRKLGYDGESYLDEIPGGYGYIPILGTVEAHEPIYTLPSTGTYTLLLDGQTLTQTTPVTLAQFGSRYAVSISGLDVSATTQDLLSIANDGKWLTYQASTPQSPTLTLAGDGTNASYGLELQSVDLASDDAVTLLADFVAGNLRFDGMSASGGAYNLDIRMVSDTGLNTFYHADITILATDTHFINFGSWDGSGTITLQIDHGSDGTIDATMELTNQPHLPVFLPLVTMNR
jgi:hypothetical protein